ncbi:MAG: intradiol ring-cleavage dioxygenase [Nitrospirota bacterium]|nr:intradiol ring-cleavage dioxygenase [Nitrospirota bacterium]
MKKLIFTSVIFSLVAGVTGAGSAGTCIPTEPDALGPFYKPDAPVRHRVGSGYLLSGTVKSSADCKAVPNARVEFWLVSPSGEYDDNHRATVYSGEKGTYRFESNFPPPYYGRPAHIHIRVTAEGFSKLVTQHYPRAGSKKGRLNLVLVPEAGR